MKEHPILFSTEMVKAILEGRKTQTRRALKPQPIDVLPMNVPDEWVALTEVNPNHGKVIKCRFGQVGDRLWVRETFHYDDEAKRYYYKADSPKERFCYEGNWKPSIFMPRWASRITLEITGIRIERLQNITQQEAKAEGSLFWWQAGDGARYYGHEVEFSSENVPESKRDYIKDFHQLWDSINGKKYPWSSNPWVWCLSFETC